MRLKALFSHAENTFDVATKREVKSIYIGTMKRERADNINPAILSWARESAALSIEEAAKKIGLKDSTKSTAGEKLLAFENGSNWPTLAQLKKIADAYYRPLGVFYRNQVPIKSDYGTDFRTFSGRKATDRENALLDALLRKVHVQQSMVKDILEDDEETIILNFVASMSSEDSAFDIAQKIRELIELKENSDFSNFKNSNDVFAHLRNKIEELGVFVIIARNLGNYHTDFETHVFRGFALADNIAPFIVINDYDARAARSFTLIHELAHIILGTTGISNSPTFENSNNYNDLIERKCNDAASEVLFPQIKLNEELRQAQSCKSIEEILLVADALAQKYNVSTSLITYRLYRVNFINHSQYKEVNKSLRDRWNSNRENLKRKNRESEGGPDFYKVRGNQLGKSLVQLIAYTLRSGELTYTKAASALGVKPYMVEKLVQNVSASGNANVAEV